MKRTRTASKPPISMAAIRRYARQIAERFDPDKIILFGSYAWRTPNEDSDVDLFVIMPARNAIDQAVRISWELPAPFALDLLVCTPAKWKLRVEDDESFIRTLRTKGKVLYEKGDASVDQESRGRSSRRRSPGRRSGIPA